MPNYFQLLRKSDGQPEAFNKVDELICEHFGVRCDEKNWYCKWYPVVMEWGVAMGRDLIPQIAATVKDLGELREKRRLTKAKFKGAANDAEKKEMDAVVEDCTLAIATKQTQLEILCFLDAHYTANAWARVGK